MTVLKLLPEKAGLASLLALFTLVFTNPGFTEPKSPPMPKCGGGCVKSRFQNQFPADGSIIYSCKQGVRFEARDGYLIAKDANGRDHFDAKIKSVTHHNYSMNTLRWKRDRGYFTRAVKEKQDCRELFFVEIEQSVEEGNRYAFLKPDGMPLIEPVQFFSFAEHFPNRFSVVAQTSDAGLIRFGIIDKTGAFTRPLGPGRLSSVYIDSPLIEGVFKEEKEGKVRYINEKGEEIKGYAEFIRSRKREKYLTCRDGNIIFGNGDSFGLASPDGRIIIPAKYHAIGCFDGEVAWVPNEMMKKWCLIGPEGKFGDLSACKDTFYPRRYGGMKPAFLHEDRFESSVLWTRAYYRYGMDMLNEPPKLIPKNIF